MDNGNEMNSHEEFEDYGDELADPGYDDELCQGSGSGGEGLEMGLEMVDDELDCAGNVEGYVVPKGLDTSGQYLENLQLKLEILNREKETMSDYFATFSSVIDGLRSEIERLKAAGSNKDEAGEVRRDAFRYEKSELKDLGAGELGEAFEELDRCARDLSAGLLKFGRDQASFEEDLKVTENFARVEKRKLSDEIDECRAKLVVRDEEIVDLKRQLEEVVRRGRVSSQRQSAVRASAHSSQSALSELKEGLDRLFAHIESLN